MPALRLMHFADVHFGVENYGRFDPATGLNSRLADFRDALNAVDSRQVGFNVLETLVASFEDLRAGYRQAQ